MFSSFQLFGQTLTTNQVKEDFDTLRHALEEAHGGLYRLHSKSEIDQLFIQQRKKLKEPMDQFQFYGFLSKLLADIGDGHMKLEFDEASPASMPKPLLFPFRILTEKNKAIILSNDTKNDSVIKPYKTWNGINKSEQTLC